MFGKKVSETRVVFDEHITENWASLIEEAQRLGIDPDHIHAVIKDEEYGELVCHLDTDGEPMGPQVVMMEEWTPRAFDSISVDADHPRR